MSGACGLRRGEYQLHFGADGRVATITGDGEVTSQVIYLPPRTEPAAPAAPLQDRSSP